MARIQIQLPEKYRSTIERGCLVPAKCYEILVDGRKIEGLTGVTVTWDVNGVPTATLSIYVGGLEIDAMALANLQLHVAQKEGA